MSWIKDNKFMVALGGGTLVGAAALIFWGMQGSSRYQAAKDEFDAAAAEAAGFESLALYPKLENQASKRKALDEYRKSLGTLQSAFEAFRTKELKNATPQEFANSLLAVNTEVREAFGASGALVPEPFFAGFEKYKTSLAPAKITGVLDYQLTSIKKVLLALAATKPTELKNLYRPSLPEEDGQAYTPGASDAARSFPVEITFVGPEKSAREFLSAITKPEDQYVVVRNLRIINEKTDPPKTADAKFDAPAKKEAAPADAFSGGFVLPGDDASSGAAAGTSKPEPKPVDTSRILSQVLGSEKIQVFVRLDVLQFLPVKKLP
ncbi:MAG: Amuc_1100 family pilus-like protein [Akkermansiaceae bacterium]|nr:Amuc_1100 family pilus-like protein [Akkermansiaceae bacterium]